MAETCPNTLADLAKLTGAALRGDGSAPILGVAGIQNAREGEIALIASLRYHKFLSRTGASALVVGPKFDASASDWAERGPLPLLVAEKPEEAFEAIAAHFHPEPALPEPGVHPSAVVAAEADIDPTASIGACCVVDPGAVVGPGTVLRPLVFVGREARIGAGCVLHPHVAVLERCVLGDRVVLHSGVVVGADGFGYDTVDGMHRKSPQRGSVEIGSDVEVGANVTIDRARFGRTAVGSGTKIDNLVQVAHNVSIGEHSIIVAQAGIAGSTTLGHHVVLAAQVGLKDHIQLGDGAMVAAQSGVDHDVQPGEAVFGSPAQDIRNERRCMILYQRLPEQVKQAKQLAKTVEDLEERLKRLEGASEDD